MTGTALSGVLIVIGGTVAAVLGLLCVARWRPRWRHEGHNDVMGVFFSMDKMIGKDFEKGLVQLKAVAEK